MPLHLPPGKRLAVAITADFDAHTNWMAAGLTNLGYISRGEFGAEVGLPRLLDLLLAHGIRGTFFITGQVVETFPEQTHRILDLGHEVATHGCYHENLTKLTPERERTLLARQLEQHDRVTHRRPRGYRAPGWEFSDMTLSLLEEFGFEWDSSLMGRDFEPYRPRPYSLNLESRSIPGPQSPILEMPVSWYLDDFQFFEFAPSLGIVGGVDRRTVLDIWVTNFDYALANVAGGVFILTVHPQTIGRAHNLMMLGEFLSHVEQSEGIWYCSLSDVFDTWTDGYFSSGATREAKRSRSSSRAAGESPGR